jgi:hypothetical protein
MVVFFYRLLPTEVAYYFKSDGSPARMMGRGLVILLALLPQFFLSLLAGALVWVVTRISARALSSGPTWIGLGRIMMLMGNMVVLPQLILGFVMLDIFSYNSYQIHLIPLWLFAIIVMGLGGMALGIFFIYFLMRAREVSQQQEPD